MEEALRKILDFCERRNKEIFFDDHGQIRLNGDTLTVQELAAEINKDEQRRCHEDLVARVRNQIVPLDGSVLDVLIKASESSLAQQ